MLFDQLQEDWKVLNVQKEWIETLLSHNHILMSTFSYLSMSYTMLQLKKMKCASQSMLNPRIDTLERIF